MSALDVMLDCAVWIARAGDGERGEELEQARAAVAELVEAGRELQDAMDDNEKNVSRFDKSSADRFHAADARHRAALARCGGAE